MNSGDSLRGEELVDGGVVGRWKPTAYVIRVSCSDRQ